MKMTPVVVEVKVIKDYPALTAAIAFLNTHEGSQWLKKPNTTAHSGMGVKK